MSPLETTRRMSNTLPLLTVNKLNVTIDNEKIINNLSFSVNSTDIITILGPNGAGKTVLLQALMGLISHTGEITWQHKPRIGYLPQGLTQLAVKDYPLTVQDFFSLKGSYIKSTEMIRFLNLVGLEKDVLDKKACDLSGGQFQRMLISWVLVSHPQVLFFDEPATGIDIGGGETIYSLLRTIHDQEKITTLLITHDLNIVYRYSTKVLCLNRKGIPCFGKPDTIMNAKTLQQLFGPNMGTYRHRLERSN